MDVCLSVKWTAGEVGVDRAKSVFVFSVRFSKSSSDKLISSRPELHPIVCFAMIGSGNTAAHFSTTSILMSQLKGLQERGFG